MNNIANSGTTTSLFQISVFSPKLVSIELNLRLYQRPIVLLPKS